MCLNLLRRQFRFKKKEKKLSTDPVWWACPTSYSARVSKLFFCLFFVVVFSPFCRSLSCITRCLPVLLLLLLLFCSCCFLVLFVLCVCVLFFLEILSVSFAVVRYIIYFLRSWDEGWTEPSLNMQAVTVKGLVRAFNCYSDRSARETWLRTRDFPCPARDYLSLELSPSLWKGDVK